MYVFTCIEFSPRRKLRQRIVSSQPTTDLSARQAYLRPGTFFSHCESIVFNNVLHVYLKMEKLKSLQNGYLEAMDGPLFCERNIETAFNNSEIKGLYGYPHIAAEFGTFTGIAAALLVNLFFAFKILNKNKSINWNEICRSVQPTAFISAKTISITALLSFLFVSLPLLISLSIIALVYKSICILLIKRQDRRYAGLLDSFDVFWSLEDDTSKSIINVFGIIESESPEHLVSSIKEKLKTVHMEGNECMEKIFLRRSEEYGFYYWRRYSTVDLNEYIKIIESGNEDKLLNERDLEELMTEHTEKPLPYKNEGLFKILVTRNPVKEPESAINAKRAYGIIFAIHHSLGDGIALIEFLCQSLADDEGNSAAVFKAQNFLHEQKQKTPIELIDKIHALIQMPGCFVRGIIRKPDESILHGPPLTGNKVFTWTRSDENLLRMMKEVKDNVKGVKCMDLLTAALSRGLTNYLTQRMTNLPEDVSVILPIRFPKDDADDSLKLVNNFSVAIVDVPIQSAKGVESNLDEIMRRYGQLRTSSDPITNYYFLKFACSVLPSQVLKPMLTSKQATLVLSNLPGPETLTICGGNTLKHLVFFVPNKGNTGLGVTALSYGGVLRLAAAADCALISSSSELKIILDGMVEEIRCLHRLHCSQ